MDSNEIAKVMRRRLPVMYDGKRYDRISEYIMWYDNDGKRRLSLVLIQGNSCFRVPADKVEPVKEGNDG